MVKMTVKMAAVCTITLLLLSCSVITSTASPGNCDYSVAMGDNFTVLLDYQLTNSHILKWKRDNHIIFGQKPKNKGVEVYTGQATDIFQNGSLKLTQLNKDSKGTYTPEVFDSNGNSVKQFKSTTLCVLDRVTKPRVTVSCLKPTKPKASPSVKFTCTFEPKNLKIEWLRNKEVMKNESNPQMTQVVEKVEQDFFSCRVSNPVSFMTSDPVKQNCTKSKSSFLFDKVMGVQIWIIIVCGGGVVLLLILIVIVCCIMNRRKKRLHLKDEEELRLDWTNPDQEPQHHHHHLHPHHNQLHHKHHQHNHPPDHHHHQQQPAGHTGPRQHRSRQHREQRPRAPDPPGGHPQPSPRRPAQGPGPVAHDDDEQPPPLPQPRKKAVKPARE